MNPPPSPSPRPARYLCEYAALRALAAVVRVLPYRPALCFGCLLARSVFVSLGRPLVREARSRIRRVFADRYSAAEITNIAWQSWRNLVFNAVELLRVPRLTPQALLSRGGYEEIGARLKPYTDTGRGAVIACPHMGNWELAGLACRYLGIPIFSIAGRQRNPLVNAYLNELRRQTVTDILERGRGTMRDVLRKLKEGRALAILPDVRVRSGGVRIPFLGGEANVGAGMALFARQADVPVFPCLALREGWSRHRAVVGDPVEPDKSLDKREDVVRMTAAVLSEIERAIRQDPGQWFWYNRRWVLDPVDTPQEGLGNRDPAQ